MRKILVAFCIVLSATLVRADVAWSWWMENGMRSADLSFGLASKCRSVESFELSLLYSASTVEDGLQVTFPGINDSDSNCALQLSLWFNRGKNPCVQLGMINIAESACFTMGCVNVSSEAKVQLGLLNFNKSGFLPFFPFVNLDPSIFD